MKQIYKRFLCLALVLAAASALCLSLNRWDNKYTYPGTQAIDGLLILSQEELQKNDVHFLINGWAFYPDILLTPETLKERGQNHYMFYTSIGEHTSFCSVNDKDPHGCGTYVLTIILPEEAARYALELPEIFSAYKLYLNHELILQMGHPEQEIYTPLIQNHMVTFEAGGTVTFLLAVSDYSHVYSGMVYPPAFGSVLSLNLIHNARLGLTLCLMLIGFLAAVLSCYMGIRMHHKNGLLFSLLCLTAGLFISYPLLHSNFALPPRPWYAIEIFSGYFMTLLVLVLQNRLCCVKLQFRYISEFIGIVFCILALCYGISSPYLTLPFIKGFSMLSAIYKLYIAGYLLLISFLTLYLQTFTASILFYGSVFYSTLLIWDRILPDFEPIISGWFSEWGSFALIFVIGAALWHKMVTAYSYSVTFAEEHRQMERQLAMQLEYAGQLQKQIEEKRRLVHDFRQHLHTITELIIQIRSVPDTAHVKQELLHYLEESPKTLSHETSCSVGMFCNRIPVDALLQYYSTTALRLGVCAEFIVNIPDNVSLTDVEWCSVLGNLLENALDACQRQRTGKKTVILSAHQIQGTFFLKIENTYDGKYKLQNGHFLSRKNSELRVGMGLESVKKIITQHGGTVDIYPRETTFTVGITLPKLSAG